MPNTGKPSLGCKNCRDKRSKCDQKRPSCSQCLRTQRRCHGYRDPLELMFRNESNVVAQKAAMKYKKSSKSKTKHAPVSGYEAHSACYGQLVLRRASTQTPGSVLESSIEDQGIGFFLFNFVQPSTLVPGGNLDFLPEVLGRPETEQVLRISVTAAGLAGLANASKSPQIMRKAQELYVAALNMTNKALQAEESAVKDSTLISVIMLGMYENLRCENMNSIKSWEKHVNGAWTLINLRGRDQVHGRVGNRILQQFYGTCLLVATQVKSTVPREIAEIWEANTWFGDFRGSGKHCRDVARFVRLAVDLQSDSDRDPVSLVTAAFRLDKELDAIELATPNIWRSQTVCLERHTKHVYGNSYHIYIDPYAAQMCNMFRSIRISLHNLIRTQLSLFLEGPHQFPGFTKEELSAQINASEFTIRAVATDICASAPQVIGQIPFPELPTTTPSMETSLQDLFDPQDPMFELRPPGTFLNQSKPTIMHHLIWPLYQAGLAESGSNSLKEWAIGVLYFIALKVGTRQAVVLADDLKDIVRRGFVHESQICLGTPLSRGVPMSFFYKA